MNCKRKVRQLVKHQLEVIVELDRFKINRKTGLLLQVAVQKQEAPEIVTLMYNLDIEKQMLFLILTEPVFLVVVQVLTTDKSISLNHQLILLLLVAPY